MKKVMLFLCALILGASINAQQFTNSDFESWTGNVPHGWNTLGMMGFNLCEMTKTTDAHSGSYAVKIAPSMLSQTLATLLGMTETFAVPGIITNATINMTVLMEMLSGTTSVEDLLTEETLSNLLTDGLRISSQPSEIMGYYKYNEVEGSQDMFMMMALLVAETEGQRRIVGAGIHYPELLAKTDAYESFSMPIETIYDIPATELIFLAMVIGGETATDFSSLYLDDLNIVYTSGLESLSFDNIVVAYPNPTSGDFKLNGAEGCKVRVCDVLGREVLSVERYDGNTIRLEHKGVYFLNIDDRETQKLIVK